MPYEKITDINSLEIAPDESFFKHTEFYSSLNQTNIPFDIYENMKYLYETLKIRNLGDMNDLYNVQDAILLCEIIENRFRQMYEKSGYNPRKCNSASILTGCIQRDLPKVIITLPTNLEHAEMFEKTLTGGYSCVNNRLGFDTEVLLPKFTQAEHSKMNIDQSFQAYKNQNYKVGYKIKLNGENKYNDYRVISKLIKFEENNQYGFAITKPMLVGSIKEESLSWVKFKLLMEKVSLDNPIGHIFVVDVEFEHEKATDCQIMYNDIFPPFTDKQARIEANERSVFQLLELYSEDIKGAPKSYKISSKCHSNLLAKRCVPMYLEELKFAIVRCCWKVTKLYKHYYFEQKRFKCDFILMNQKVRQEAKNEIESDFFKLLNNANFGFDCRNNLDNCIFEPISDEISELSFIKRYYNNLFDKDISPFINARILQDEITQRFNNERQKITESDPFFPAKIRSLENRRRAEEGAVEKFKQAEKKCHKNRVLRSYSDRTEIAHKNQKIKSIIDFSDQDTASMTRKTNDKVKITTHFIKGKMLMFSKTSIRSFVYDLIDCFCFPDDEVQEIYGKNEIVKCFIYLILTDTDSCSIQFLYLSNLKAQITENQARKLLFEIILLKIGHRIDTRDDFYVDFLCQNKTLKKKVGLYEAECVDNANVVTIAVNPKEYFEVFRNKSINKKHKGVKKSTPGMDFEAFAGRIMDIREYDFAEKLPKSLSQKRISNKKYVDADD